MLQRAYKAQDAMERKFVCLIEKASIVNPLSRAEPKTNKGLPRRKFSSSASFHKIPSRLSPTGEANESKTQKKEERKNSSIFT
jgi:hypothetical protein